MAAERLGPVEPDLLVLAAHLVHPSPPGVEQGRDVVAGEGSDLGSEPGPAVDRRFGGHVHSTFDALIVFGCGDDEVHRTGVEVAALRLGELEDLDVGGGSPVLDASFAGHTCWLQGVPDRPADGQDADRRRGDDRDDCDVHFVRIAGGSASSGPDLCGNDDLSPYRGRVTVRALLHGHEFDLQTLVDMFPEGDPCIVKDDEDRFHLETAELDPHMQDAGRLVEIAERVLVDLLGAARLRHSDFRQVRIVGSFEKWEGSTKFLHVTDGGELREKAVVARAETAMIRVSARSAAAVTHPDEPAAAPEPSGARYLRLKRTHPAAAELIALLGNSDMDWADLYKAFEIVREASKACTAPKYSLEQLGYSKTEVSNFTRSVNLHRHARPSGDPPKRELELAEAQSFTREMVERWFCRIKDGTP